MRRLTAISICLVLLAGVAPALAADLTVCRDTSVDWLRYRFDGLDASAETFSYVADGASWVDEDTLVADALTADDGAVLAGQVYVAFYDEAGAWVEVWATPETEACDDGEERPGTPSIPMTLTSDCAFVEVRDEYGNWHRVYSDDQPVLLHYGESLIAGHRQSLDPEDYRTVETQCF